MSKKISRVQWNKEVRKGKHLCSGYGVYPNGYKCVGCSDCKRVSRKKTTGR